MVRYKTSCVLSVLRTRPAALVPRRRTLSFIVGVAAAWWVWAPRLGGQSLANTTCYSYQELLARVYDVSGFDPARLGISAMPMAHFRLDWQLAVTVQRQERDTLWVEVTVDSANARLLKASPELAMFRIPATLGEGAHARGVVSLRTRDYSITASNADDSLLIPVAARLFSAMLPATPVPDGTDTTYGHQPARRFVSSVSEGNQEVTRGLLATWGVVEDQSDVQGQQVRYVTPGGVSLDARVYKTMRTSTTIQGLTIPGTGADTLSLVRLSDGTGCGAGARAVGDAGRAGAGGVTAGHFQTAGRSVAYERSRPAGAGRHPAVVLLHGAGGPVLETSYERPMIDSLTAHGYVVNFVHYFDGTGDATQDAANFVRWEHTIAAAITDLARDSAVDTARIGVMGISLGASLAVAVASSDPRVKAGVEVSGPFPYLPRKFDMPPILLLHGLADQVIPVSHAYALDTLLTERKAEHELKVYDGQGHVLAGGARTDAIERAVRFFDGHLKRAGDH